VVDDLVF